MKWRVGCDLNITEDRTVITQVRIKLGKVKVKLPLCTTYEAMEVQLHSFLTSTLDGGEWSAKCLGG